MQRRHDGAAMSNRGAGLVLACLAAVVACAGALGAALAGSASPAAHIDSTAGLSRARRLLDEGRIAEAREIFAREFKSNEKSVEAIRGLALCARDEGDDDTAFHYLRRLTALAPDDVAGWRQQALVASRLGLDMEALAAAQTALSLAPKGDRAMSDLVTRLLTADATARIPESPGLGAAGPRDVDPFRTERGGTSLDPRVETPRPEPPDPLKGLPGLPRSR